MKREEELKPCPFCGTKPNFTSVTDLTVDFDHGFSIWCGECGIEMADEYRDEVAKRWNTRSPVSLTEDRICQSPFIEWLVPTTEEWNACEVIQDRYDLVKRLVHRVFKAEQYSSDAAAKSEGRS